MATKRRKGRPAADAPEDLRGELLKAAEVEFAEHGYAGARTVRIAERAGTTHGTLHYHFQTKAMLYREVIASMAPAFTAAFAVLRSQEGGAPSVETTVRTLFLCFAERPKLVRIFLWEIAAGSRRSQDLSLPHVDAIRAGLPQLLAPFIAEGDDPRDVIASLLGATIIYFFDDPATLELFGEQRFAPDEIERRADHMQRLARRLLPHAPDAPDAGGQGGES